MIGARGVWQTLGLVFCSVAITTIWAEQEDVPESMSKEERVELKNEAKDMFYHAYRAYMENAYPADELMPLSCAGRYRGAESSRGDIDDSLGNFSLTLIDSLDTLVVLGDMDEFERAVKLVLRDVTFDRDIVVSVFETNIRVLGGLLSAHILAERLCSSSWYGGQLLPLALDLGRRLLPAFNTTTGIPHARVNLRHGLRAPALQAARETCTACAGTMVLEMAALSRLTGEHVFEEKAHRAMDELWRLRHRSSDLMGTVLNVHSGDWVRRDSGVGAGIDSYYEYCLKAYVLLGEERYLGRFNKHYSAVMKYVSQGPMLVDVHMHRPHTNSRNFMDALLAFWPGLQVLKGDLRPAVETHEMLRQVAQRHNFIPEAFTTDFQVHWGAHPLRPEFLESTYFLFRATGDAHYLHAGRAALRALQRYARVPCGYAAVKDVRTGAHEDRMDSFVLAETFKYLYLLFADPAELPLDLDEFVFTTEAHLLPLSLSRDGVARGNGSRVGTVAGAGGAECSGAVDDTQEHARSCSSAPLLAANVRETLRNLVSGVCPKKPSAGRRKIMAAQFLAGDAHHLALVKAMGISMATLPDGRVQLMHTLANAATPADGEEGLQFMQEMVELSKAQAQAPDAPPRAVSFTTRAADGHKEAVILRAGPAHFGPSLSDKLQVVGRVGVADPLRACSDLVQPERLAGRVVIVERGDCMFVDKARRLQSAGALAGVVVDHVAGSGAGNSPMFAMSGDGSDDVTIPLVFLFHRDAARLLHALERDPALKVTLADLATLQGASTEGEAVVPGSQEQHASTLDRLKDSILGFLSTKELGSEKQTAEDLAAKTLAPQGQSRATLSADEEVIRISRSDAGKTSSANDAGWSRLRKLLAERLSRSSIPPPVLQLYRQLLRDMDGARGGDDRAARLQAAFLLAELAKLDVDEDNVVKGPVVGKGINADTECPSSQPDCPSEHSNSGFRADDEL